jgi:methylglutaconyl-CoA hydratase
MKRFATLELLLDSRGLATLWLDRPDVNNAFNAQMIDELHEALTQVQGDSRVRLLVLRGRGQHFSAGADLRWMQASAQLGLEANLAEARRLSDLMHRLYTLPLPTLAVVRGAAFAGALGLVSCCDMAIAADDARFSLSEVRLGLAPAVISPYVVRAIGARATRRYTLTGDRFTAADALALGLLAEVSTAPALDNLVTRWTANLLRNGPQAMRASKALLTQVTEGSLDEPLRRRTEQVIAELRSSPEGQEGMCAFLEKRTPAWQEAQS